MSERDSEALDLAGIGSMVLDRMHKTRRVLGPNEKGLLDPVPADGDGGPVQACIGGLMLNQIGWAALFGLRVGLFGRQADDEAGRFLRAAMKRHGIETHLDLTGRASSIAEIFIDAAGERAIYMAAAATSETRPAHVREDHADFMARARRVTTEISQLPLDTTLAVLELARDLGPLGRSGDVGPGDGAVAPGVLGRVGGLGQSGLFLAVPRKGT